MNSEPFRSHIAPRSYLNNFGSLAPGQKSPRLSVLSRRTGEIESQVKTKDIFYRHFYNHVSPEGEHYESAEKPLNTVVEEPGNRVLRTLLYGQAINYAQTRHLARYLLIAILRSLWFHICLRAVLIEHSKIHGYSAERVPELTQRKQVELLRAFMGLPTTLPTLYKDDPLLAEVFKSSGSLTIKGSKRTVESLVEAFLRYREITIYTAPRGAEFITGDNYVIPMLDEAVENFLDIPFHNATELLMPLSPSKLVHVSGRTSDTPGISVSRKPLSAAEVENANNLICIFASAHIFSTNEKLLKETHDRNPFFDGKIVEVGGKEFSYFPYPSDLPQKFRS